MVRAKQIQILPNPLTMPDKTVLDKIMLNKTMAARAMAARTVVAVDLNQLSAHSTADVGLSS